MRTIIAVVIAVIAVTTLYWGVIKPIKNTIEERTQRLERILNESH